MTLAPIFVPMTVAVQETTVPMSVEETTAGIPVSVAVSIEVVEGEKYTGEYTVTPSQETQILPTKDLVMTQDVVINPIPSNYGLITWDGNTLTIS